MASPPRFVGSHGEDWCVRPAQLGPPDRVTPLQMQWLIVPGPPISCYLAFMTPSENPLATAFYHQHPSTWSLHAVLSGSGKHHVDDKEHDVGPGSVIYQGPGVRHALYPNPGHHLMHLSIQHPAAGWTAKEWLPCPEAGTPDHFGELQAFLDRFGVASGPELMKALSSKEIYASERWNEYVRKPR